MRPPLTTVVASAITTVLLFAGTGLAAAEPAELRHCEVTDGRQPQTATPAEVGIDPAALRMAMGFVSDPARRNVQVFRNNCLIAAGPHNAQTGGVPWNLWSSTKSVVSMVAGIAVDDGYLRLDDPLGAYLPAGLGGAAHRAITVRNLLTESSGLQVAVLSEGVTGLAQLDPNVVAQAMARPVEFPQGTEWRYSQRAVDLIAYIVAQAAGTDFQAYAQRKLFDPLGIRSDDYYWGRDRTGNTYGYAHLVLPPDDFVKLGLLITNRGNWHGTQVISTGYLDEAMRPSAANPCYGFLFVVNGPECGAEFPGLPADAVKMSGMMRQDAYIVPSLGLLVAWTGVTVPNGGGSFPHDTLRAIVGGFQQPRLPDPGPYVPQEGIDLGDPMMSDPDALFAALGVGPESYPGCGALTCLGKTPGAPFADWPLGCVILGCLGTAPATPGIR